MQPCQLIRVSDFCLKFLKDRFEIFFIGKDLFVVVIEEEVGTSFLYTLNVFLAI
jgi:hypothetical protein